MKFINQKCIVNLILLASAASSVLALEQNPIAPPKAEIVDRFGVNLQTGQLARTLNTVSIGGDIGLAHSVQLYTDLFIDGGYYGFVDGFAGRAKPENISQNSVVVMENANGDPLFLRDLGGIEHDHTKRISVMRVYGPAGSQDFLVYQNGVLSRDASAYSGNSTATGITFKALGDTRHTLVQSADKTSLIWTTPNGTESKYTSNPVTGYPLEVTYPNGLKVRVGYKAVTTNTGFMLKYQLNTQGLNGTPDQIVALNRANQYCSEDAATACSSAGWPTATFTWPLGTPSTFYSLGLPPSSYTIKMNTEAGVTDIQYQPEDVCVKEGGGVDAECAGSRSGAARWIPRLRSIKTPESTVPNYQYTYKNKGEFYGGTGSADGFSWGYTYWSLLSTSGQIVNATLNGTDSQGYSGPTINSHNANITWGNGEIWVVSSQYELNVIESVTHKKSGTYTYLRDARHLIEKFYPVPGRGPALHYYYDGPRGNLNRTNIINASGSETLFQEAAYSSTCDYPKTCNKPLWVKDARGNVTNYEYDPQGRFGSPIKITSPADNNGKRAITIYNYEPRYAYYKRNGEAITQDPDPVWMLTSEHTCRTSDAISIGCVGGDLDMVKTSYYYGPQNGAQANNLLLRGKSIVAQGSSGLETRVWCYEYDKYGKLIGETLPKGNSTNLESCQ